MSSRARRVFVEGPASLGQRARSRRWRQFCSMFPDVEQLRVLDLGGTVDSWMAAPVRPARLHLVNTVDPPRELPTWMTAEHGDACALDLALLDGRFDLVYSNSVIEHVGGHARRIQFADMVRAAAPRHWVQTPYRYFPIEPHVIVPMLQYLPLLLRARITMHWPLVHTRPRTLNDAVSQQLATELLDITEMRHYFPLSTIAYERVGGVIKSVIAVQT